MYHMLEIINLYSSSGAIWYLYAYLFIYFLTAEPIEIEFSGKIPLGVQMVLS